MLHFKKVASNCSHILALFEQVSVMEYLSSSIFQVTHLSNQQKSAKLEKKIREIFSQPNC